jgi:hypothetical protein
VISLPLLLALMPLSDPSASAGTSLAPGYRGEGASVAPPGSSFHYRYVEAALLLGDFDGLRGSGTLHITGPWIGLGRLDYLTEDEGSTDVDLFLLSGGVGYVHTVEEELDFIGSAELELGHIEVDTPGGDADDDELGLRFRGGVRFQASDVIELDGGLSFSTIFDDELGLDGQVLYAFKEGLSGFVGLDIRDETLAMIGVRFDL